MLEDLSPIDPNVQWIIAEARRPVVIDPAARERLMEALKAEEAPVRRPRVVGWLMQARRFSLPPLATLAAAAGLVGIGVITGLVIGRDGRAPTEQHPAVAANPQLPDSLSARVVKFVLVAPQAEKVSLVGDFNGWDTEATPATRQSDGTWATFVQLAPGRHVYSFVLDGKVFMNDPAAPVTPDDGYGQKNSVVVVKGATS
jgi:hypothetical protein